MKEFIEKLISRLEEQKKRYREIRKNTYCRITEMDDCDSCRADHYLDARLEGINKAKEIVNQLAEEYNKEHDDTDYANIELYNFWQKHQWIPCSERLPEQTEPFQTAEFTVTVQFVKNGKKSRPFTSHASFDFESEKWLIKGYEVIAWREQIAPYQPKEGDT